MPRPRYLADTDILSDVIRNPAGGVARQLLRAGEGATLTSIVVACELRFGALKKQSAALSQRVDDLLASIEVLPLNVGVDRVYAQLRWALESAGTPIGPNDLLIAAHALDMGLTLVTNNVREFSRIKDLRVENWLDRSEK
jgi:tRNA(fMet)-specific endonuclease VapC